MIFWHGGGFVVLGVTNGVFNLVALNPLFRALTGEKNCRSCLIEIRG